MESTHESLWRATHQLPAFPALDAPRHADVAIVGGGITGLTAAVALARAGRRVTVLERERIGAGETGNTTAHLTEAVDGRYRGIIKDFGEEGARLVATSSRDAIDWIERFTQGAAVDCGFGRVPGYLYTEAPDGVEDLARELDAARSAGCDVRWVDRVPLPFANAGGVEWPRQAQLHAGAYLDALTAEALAHGVVIHEATHVANVTDGEPCRIETANGEVTAADVFVAAHVPVNNRVLLHTKIAAYRSYVLALRPGEPIAAGLYWDTASPYHYTRLQTWKGETYLIVGGEDHRTGMETETESHYQRLRDFVRPRFGARGEMFSWSGQIIEPVDGLPYIGVNAGSTHVYVATGYSGNGMTFGTLAGLIVSDLITGRENPYAELYSATRVKPLAAAADYVSENVAFPAHLVADRLTNLDVDPRPVDALAPGEGGVFAGPDGKLAICRGTDGELRVLSAVCTHLGCDVAWNGAEKTWDCPCHGSRFSPDGKVINGPAVADLPRRQVPKMTTRM